MIEIKQHESTIEGLREEMNVKDEEVLELKERMDDLMEISDSKDSEILRLADTINRLEESVEYYY